MALRGLSYEMTGHRGLLATLEKVSPLLRRELEVLNRQTAYAIKHRAQTNAPKDRGDLAANISVQGKGMNWRVGVLDVAIASRGGSNTAHLNPSVYGVWYEYGFVTRSIAKHPFMRPAVDAVQPSHDAGLRQIAAKLDRVAT